MTEQREKEMKLIISKFNSLKGKHNCYKTNEHLYEPYEPLLEKFGLQEILKRMADFDGDYIFDFLQIFGERAEAPVKEQKVEQGEMFGEAKGSGLELLETAIASGIGNSILGKVETKIDAFIKENYGALPKVIKVQTEKTTRELKGIFHEKFEEVLSFVGADVPVFLSGPAGSGKNVICKQVSEAFELEFYFSNAVTQEYKITGFTDANGVFHESQFYKAFKDGGLFFLDEMDASVPEVLIILNAAIANKYFDFPAPIGKVDAHEDFRVVSAGNTFGLGASIEYTGRNQLDGASLDRFAVIEIDYSPAIEMAVCNEDKELVDFIHSFRKSCKTNGVHSIASYRAIERIYRMKRLVGLETAVKTCLVKNLRPEDLSMLVSDIEPSIYRTILKKLSA
jgi:cobaltochelatase CobS